MNETLEIRTLNGHPFADETARAAAQANAQDIDLLDLSKVSYVYAPSRNLFDERTKIEGAWWTAYGLESNEWTGRYSACEVKVTGHSAVTISAENLAGDNPRLYNYFLVDADGSVSEEVIVSAYQPFTIAVPSGAAYIRFNVNLNSDEAAEFRIMVSSGTEALPYEPFGIGEKLYPGELEIDALQKNAVFCRIVQGSRIDAVEGDTVQVFFDSIIEGLSEDMVIEFRCAKGRNYPRYWEYTPAAGDAGEYPVRVSVRNLRGSMLAEAECTLKVTAAASPVSRKHILCVGDSTMAQGQIPIEASRRIAGTAGSAASPAPLALSNIAFVGRKRSGDGTVGWEGNGGWSYGSYVIAGSPAVRFTVSGAGTLGINDLFIAGDFRLRIAEINLTGGSGEIRCLFDSETPYSAGWNSTAQSGTLISASGSGQPLAYSAWTLENSQPFWNPDTDSFDILSYRDAYCGGQIDILCVLLGINSLIGLSPFDSPANTVDEAKVFCRRVHSQLPGCRILLSTLPPASPCGGIGANYSAASNAGSFSAAGMNHRILAFNAALTDAMLDSEFADYVSVIPSHSQFDAANGYPAAAKPLNTRTEETEILQTNAVHPNLSGYWQLSDALAFRAVLGALAE